MKTLSVVVPVYNVEPYLPQCLESLAAQSRSQIEVVLVDDGSTDRSGDLAQEWATDHGWIFVEQTNLGLSAARNAGVAQASGDLVAFCDSDDVVPPDAYASLCHSLEVSGSDIASGAVVRLDSTGTRPHPRYQDLFRHTRRGTHIRDDPTIVLDRMVWNKVFRRDFWERNHFEFSLRQYEDAPVTMAAHLRARSVDVLSDVVYLWRIRESGERSITQRLYEPPNILARMRMVHETWRVLEHERADLTDAYVQDMCAGDVRIACEALLNSGDGVLPALRLARQFLVEAGEPAIGRLPPREQQRARAVLALDLDQIRSLPA